VRTGHPYSSHALEHLFSRLYCRCARPRPPPLEHPELCGWRPEQKPGRPYRGRGDHLSRLGTSGGLLPCLPMCAQVSQPQLDDAQLPLVSVPVPGPKIRVGQPGKVATPGSFRPLDYGIQHGWRGESGVGRRCAAASAWIRPVHGPSRQSCALPSSSISQYCGSQFAATLKPAPVGGCKAAPATIGLGRPPLSRASEMRRALQGRESCQDQQGANQAMANPNNRW
jgi:hypothetical protein